MKKKNIREFKSNGRYEVLINYKGDYFVIEPLYSYELLENGKYIKYFACRILKSLYRNLEPLEGIIDLRGAMIPLNKKREIAQLRANIRDSILDGEVELLEDKIRRLNNLKF